jgi:hypothetical protein
VVCSETNYDIVNPAIQQLDATEVNEVDWHVVDLDKVLELS